MDSSYRVFGDDKTRWLDHHLASGTLIDFCTVRSSAARSSAQLRLDTMMRRRQSEPRPASASSDDVPNVRTASQSEARPRWMKRPRLTGRALSQRDVNAQEHIESSDALTTRQMQPPTFLLDFTLSFRADSRQLSEAICSSRYVSSSKMLSPCSS